MRRGENDILKYFETIAVNVITIYIIVNEYKRGEDLIDSIEHRTLALCD